MDEAIFDIENTSKCNLEAPMNIKSISRGVLLSLSMGLAVCASAASTDFNCRCNQVGDSHENLNCKCTEAKANEHGKSGSIGQVLSDSAITAAIKSKLLADSQTSGLKISVETIKGIVNLTGTADSQAEKQAAERIARNSKGVHDVKNNIELTADSHS
jgi:hyperosmotically inducible periplasmic protein